MCAGCLVPFLAPILAWLGLPVPLLPAGPLRYVLAVLATYRMVQMVGLDDGPFGLFLWLREKIGVYDRGPNGEPKRAIARPLACPHCLGMIIALLNGYLVLWPALDGDILLVVFGLAGAFSSLQEWLHGPREGWG